MSEATRRDGPLYQLTDADIEAFHKEGYVHLPGVLAESELAELEKEYMRFLRGDYRVEGRDFCDMSSGYDRPVEDYAVVNIMLPTRYRPAWSGNLYEQRVASIARQLYGVEMAKDYDQLLAKPPGHPDGVFAWHQDLAYWPITTDPRTATAWLALDDATEENGCMRFVPGSHREPALRPHEPLHGDRDKSHGLAAKVDPAVDTVRLAEIRRGDATIHSERTLHGSGPNVSDRWRRAYILAYRTPETIAEERRRGFTHSHNDEISVLDRVGFADPDAS